MNSSSSLRRRFSLSRALEWQVPTRKSLRPPGSGEIGANRTRGALLPGRSLAHRVKTPPFPSQGD